MDCILPDSIFLKHTKKEKQKKRKKKTNNRNTLIFPNVLSTLSPSKQTNLSSWSPFGAADLTQNLFPTG